MRALEDSGIVEVFNYGRDRQGLIPLWVGEGDLATPEFIVEAAKASLAAGETFYTYQRGVPKLREAIARYMTRVYGAAPGGNAFAPEQFFVTCGGMHALEIAVRLAAGPGEEILVPSPAWPNFQGAIAIAGARTVFAPMIEGTSWRLDLDGLSAAVGPATRAIILNSPANPTGFTATIEELVAVLDLARRRGLWIIADEIYGRLVFGGGRAPSFHDVMAPDDRILFVQTLSKNWAMTGWRIGWLEAPPALGPVIENLVQYTTSGVPVFSQRAAKAAIEAGEEFFARQLARMRKSRDILCEGLKASGRARFALPEATFYLFCAFEGFADSRLLARRLIDEAGVGVAPGAAFGPGGQAFMRICFARSPEEMAEATRRLTRWLAN
ncbi:MAG TPA: pyridoxal phosphate-dependent aminotransferase [Roseiarcus sp.]|nr:pyridoxal phosphate-dependent aminotransferase [Roseiarcus sp.]